MNSITNEKRCDKINVFLFSRYNNLQKPCVQVKDRSKSYEIVALFIILKKKNMTNKTLDPGGRIQYLLKNS